MPVVNSFADIQADFLATVERIVWCNVATIDTQGRPRSRVLHPLWEGTTGWILTSPTSLKAKHIANNEHLSLAYIAEPLQPLYVEATAEWISDQSEKKRLWDLFTNTPEPYGYDPTPFFSSVDSPRYGVLKLTPWRIELYNLMTNTSQVWKS